MPEPQSFEGFALERIPHGPSQMGNTDTHQPATRIGHCPPKTDSLVIARPFAHGSFEPRANHLFPEQDKDTIRIRPLVVVGNSGKFDRISYG